MNTTNNTKKQPEIINSKKFFGAKIRRQQKTVVKEEGSKAMKKTAGKSVQAQCDKVLLQKTEEILKSLKAHTWYDLEIREGSSKMISFPLSVMTLIFSKDI